MCRRSQLVVLVVTERRPTLNKRRRRSPGQPSSWYVLGRPVKVFRSLFVMTPRPKPARLGGLAQAGQGPGWPVRGGAGQDEWRGRTCVRGMNTSTGTRTLSASSGGNSTYYVLPTVAIYGTVR